MVRENHKNIKRHKKHRKRPGRFDPPGAFFSPLFQALGRRNQPQKRESPPLGKKSASGAEKNQKKRRGKVGASQKPAEKVRPWGEKVLQGRKKIRKNGGEGGSKLKTHRKSQPLERKSAPGAEKNQKKRRRG
ncbi:MAG: hypothetical protein ACLRS1_06425 [Oscillospiraceae bacterium]